MKIENAKKIEVWEFEDGDGDHCYLLPNVGLYSADNKNYQCSSVDDGFYKQAKQAFAELESKEQVQKAMDNFISESAVKYQLTIGKDAILKANQKPKQEEPASPIQEIPESTLQLTLNEDYLKELIRNEVAKLEAKYEHLNAAMVVNHKNVTITKNLVDSLSPQRFEILEQRIEALEYDNKKLVKNCDGIFERLNSAKLSI